MSAKHDSGEQEPKKTPGLGPAEQARLQPGGQAEQRYGPSGPTSEATMPANTAAPNSIASQVAAEVARVLAALGLAKPPEQGQAQSRQESNRRMLAERQKREEEELANQVAYVAKADGFVPSPVPGGGGLYVKQGETFMFSGTPSDRWMVPTDERGEERMRQRRRQLADRAAAAANNEVASSALAKAQELLERHGDGPRERFVPNRSGDPQGPLGAQ